MLTTNKFRAVLLGCAAVALLGACSGADGVASPGAGAFVPPPTTTPPPTTPPTTPPPTGGAAADCPTGFANVGTVSDMRICQLPNDIIGNLVVPKRDGTVYSINGRTQVGTDLGPNPNDPAPGGQAGILTIEPGVTLFGDVGLNYLLVNRGSQIFAEGTAAEPIIMTSRERINGTATENTIGRWGGLVINGRAPTADGCITASVTPPNIACEAQVEGSNAYYGGNSPSDSSGRIRYLQLSYSGWSIAPDNELNGITFAGVGNGTTVDHVQVHNSSDDGIEIFGGNLNLSHIVLTGNDDDSFDTDSGWRGAAQFGIVYQRDGGGDFGWETSSRGTNTADFFTRPTYANWTVVMRNNGTRDAIVHNTGHTARVYNSVIRHPGAHQCLNIATAVTLTNPNGVAGNGPLYNSVFFSCDGGNVEGASGVSTVDAEALINAGANNVLNGVSTLTNGFINGANENAITASAFPTSLNAGIGLSPSNTFITDFLEPVDYIGAVRDANDDWYAGWTCSLPGQPTCH
ncbi:hypothetical protein K1X12_12285 [Hyphomonas sp. WL0036]|uniref:hypothetical protein n=1 Tax=Hyphomonas sediminis TaxID=2866160 RepID=UPI001C7F4786|nr:hypothetical protein [Hyphomonas sediminis]MBY9067681.1 hypothetical protein [Hyphomonas sediminis]